MTTKLKKMTVLAGAMLAIGATCNLPAAPLLAESENQTAGGFSAATLDAIKARAAKATAIAQQIRAASPMDDANYLSLNQALLGATDAGLAAASTATSYREAMSALRRATNEKVIGDLSRDFVFYPITPCRLLDTRANGIMLTGGVPFGVDFDGGNPGNAAGCTFAGVAAQIGGPLGTGVSRSALMFNLTVTQPVAAGFLQARPVGTTAITSNINYVAGQTIANMAVVQDAGTVNELELFSQVNTHALIDVMGLFAPPAATALDVTFVTNSLSVAAGTSTTLQAACGAGRTVTGGGCNFASFSSPLFFISSNPTGNSWNCAVQNRGGVADTLTVYASCGMTPGR